MFRAESICAYDNKSAVHVEPIQHIRAGFYIREPVIFLAIYFYSLRYPPTKTKSRAKLYVSVRTRARDTIVGLHERSQ